MKDGGPDEEFAVVHVGQTIKKKKNPDGSNFETGS